MRKIAAQVIGLGATVFALSACVPNQPTYEQAPDGSVKIVDSGTTLPHADVYRNEGKKLAKFCVGFRGDIESYRNAMRSFGLEPYSEFTGPAWGKNRGFKNLGAALTYTTMEKTPCRFSFAGHAGRNFYEGAIAAMKESGFTAISSTEWRKGNLTVELTGQVSSRGATSWSHTSIQRN